MPLFNSQFGWPEIGTTAVVELLILLALAFAVVGYVEWSSDATVSHSAISAAALPQIA